MIRTRVFVYPALQSHFATRKAKSIMWTKQICDILIALENKDFTIEHVEVLKTDFGIKYWIVKTRRNEETMVTRGHK